ncbi:unnamed protein product [Pieris macdunnoughi]|uniref:DNA/RNA non-specific endonuclease domain-containing protein n=1 Tax=Pieris macdunnoughi TaxID=345717 RepID=A0A821SRW2_9NEOP|nr:unnamed protein product [Pieris macdunnoughi]
MLLLLLLVCSFDVALLVQPECVIELGCPECLPEHMPLVTSHRAVDGEMRLRSGDEIRFSCGAGRLLLDPLRAAVVAVCEDGRFRLGHDASLRHLLELGCQEEIFEDVLHTVEHCAAPLQGRAYQLADATQAVRHLATLCYDEDRGVATMAHVRGASPLPPHDHARSPLSLLGNFNEMFDARTRRRAETLYSDEASLNRRLREIFKHDGVDFAGQTLAGAKLLAESYFEDRYARVSRFASNAVAAWTSVKEGNLRHLQNDVARLLAHDPALEVYAGTHGQGVVRASGARTPLRLIGGRFPVPRFVWTVVVDRRRRRALAVVVLNDPFVAVSEVREAVFCESACGRVPWLLALRRDRRYETPLYGLAFCCHVHAFSDAVPEMPRALLEDIPAGDAGLLAE